MKKLGAFIATLLLCATLLAPAHVWGQQPPPVDTDTALDIARKQIDSVQKAVNAADMTDADLTSQRDTALAARAQAEQLANMLAPQLAGVEARLVELGTPVATKGTKEAPDVAEQRTQLDKLRGTLDAQLKLARLLTVEGDQVAEQIRGKRRSLFQAQLGERTASILATRFWSDLKDDVPRDLVRLEMLTGELASTARATPGTVWGGAIFAILLIIVARLLTHRLLMRLTSTVVPPGRLRRSLHAVAVVLLSCATPGLIAQVVYVAMTWNGGGTDTARNLLITTAGAIWFGGYVAGLGSALLSPRRPSWRLPPIPDRVARHLRWFPTQLATMIVVAWVTERLGVLVNTSLSTTVAVNCMVAIALAAIMGIASMRVEHLRRQALREADQPIPPRPLWLAIVAAFSSLVLVGSLVCLLVGYVAFGSFVVKQVVWVAVVISSGYLLAVLVDDLCMGLLASSRETTSDKDKASSAAPSDDTLPRGRDQAAVLLSGVVRVCLLLFGLTLLLAPFGEGPADLFRRADQLQGGLSIGEVLIRPATVVQGMLVLVLGWLSVRWLQRWLAARYLPTTALDPGMQASAAALFGYAGYVTAAALAMSAVGVGLERVAWVASALSVGIGFGLQAVVQNFVSGLILLAERPVKVGDWVSLGGVEGDIRRINVRATEIQMGDRSTVIVPNSEFITKTVRNVTHANPLGLVQVKLPMPLDSDVNRVRDIMLASFTDHAEVLESPAPKVQLDGVEVDRLVFNATGFVSSPRLAYGVRSELLFDVLERLAKARLKAGPGPAPPITGADQNQPIVLPKVDPVQSAGDLQRAQVPKSGGPVPPR